MSRRRQAVGRQGEDLAAQWYEQQGYEVVARNWRCGLGEVDLVLRRPGVVVFCEVKARSGTGFGLPAEAVGRPKQLRVRRIAAAYLSEHPAGRGSDIRFDVAAILGTQIEILEGVF